MRKVLLFILILYISIPIVAQDSKMENDSLQIEMIDPFQENAGDFLNTDIRHYQRKAFDEYQKGNYKKSAQYYLALLKFNIHDANSIYNLACCYGLLGKDELAGKYLTRAVNAGFDNFKHIMKDPDFDNVRGKDYFDNTLDSIASNIKEKGKLLGEVVYTKFPMFLKYRLNIPEDYDPNKSYPIIIGLHGYGSSLDRFMKLWKDFSESGCIYVVPQAPYPFNIGKEIGYSWNLRVDDEEISKKTKEMSEQYIVDIVQELSEKYNTENFYLLGFSQGAHFTYNIGIKYSHLFKGIAPIGGWIEEDWLNEESLKTANELPIFIAHSKEDKVVKYENAKKTKDLLKKYGYNITFVEFEGGHTVPAEVTKQVIEWLQN
ncbi:MAG: hypothetical protein ISS28_01925 [Candidatus Cloacimonetes bacterium]|nr:hypothetical protein [Candidatus Cloacimonadota bacterium]MBL7085846.1 hypothetical protein [Candidatus Cloacimonadota bacterium]